MSAYKLSPVMTLTPLLACVLSFLLVLPHSYSYTTLLRPTKLSASRLEPSEWRTLETKLSLIRSASLCAMTDWCLVYCLTPSGQSTLMSIIAVPFNEDPQGHPWLKCFTKRSPFNILTAQSGITVHDASPVPQNFSSRVPKNLLDGINDKRMDNCYFSRYLYQPFIVFDLVDIREVKGILLMAQNNKNFNIYFHDLDIRVGTSLASGNFENYTQLSYYPGPPPYEGYELIVQPAAPIAARYLSIQMTPNETKTHLQICHLEIYV
ncbi:Galactose-binding domain-like [Trinorchestia longiramus]|nr:Galactose-binding domain-like [Trinorchestia longiramus]